ncbi:MAG: RteC domain-containing protein [Bacteroidales bacterium]
MNGTSSRLELLLDKELQQIEKTTPNPIERYEKMVRASVNNYADLKQKLKEHQFADPSSEIHFFKNVHPQAISKIHYYTALAKYYCHLAGFTTVKEKKCHCKKTLKLLINYNSHYQHIITYYKSGKSDFDTKYFLRENSDYPVALEDCLSLMDKDISTGYDLILARYLAYSKLSEFLLSEIKRFETDDKNTQLGEGGVFFDWTGSKIELIELMYAAWAKGSVSNGQITITELATTVQKVFKIELGDYYHAFTEIKNRKNPTLFLDNLRNALIKKIDEKEF